AGSDAGWTTNPIQMCPAALAAQGATNDNSVNYRYNVHVKFVGTAASSVMQRWWPKITNFGKVPAAPVAAINVGTGTAVGSPGFQFPRMPYALACDPMYDLGVAGHASGNSRAYNLLYADGSVRTAVTDL